MSVKLYKCKDYYDNDYKETRLGFDWEGFFITDPTTSECGRFHIPRADIAKTYGLTEKQIEKIIRFNRLEPEFGQRYGAWLHYFIQTLQNTTEQIYTIQDTSPGGRIELSL